ncbi:MAG: magnesium transporter [Chloroflexi bacterium]|nr:magnesium transporter [Chloroflexota bacterium]
MRMRLNAGEIRHIRTLLLSHGQSGAAQSLVSLTAPELAELLLHLHPKELLALEPLVGTERLADAMANLDPAEAARLIVRFSRGSAADILEEMGPDDATDVVEELGQGVAEDILAEMEGADAAEIRELLNYPPDTAGGRMTPKFVSIPPEASVASALRFIRLQAAEAEMIYYTYVIDRADRLVGIVSLRDLVTAEPRQRIADIMRRQVIRLPASTDQEEAARVLMAHDFLALPVVDNVGRLVGVITADDVADVLQEEASEDIERLGGSEPLNEPYLTTSLLSLFRKRVPWLLALFLAGTYTSFVLQAFSGTLERTVALAFFIPLLIGTGGNVGSQIVTTVVRSLALGQLTVGDTWRVLSRELILSVGVGAVMAASMLVRAETMQVDRSIVLVVSLAALCIVLWSALLASTLPILLQRVRIDPAVASAPLIITLIDGSGLFLYLMLARLILGL